MGVVLMAWRNMHEWVLGILGSEARQAFPLMPYIGLELKGKRISDVVRNGHDQALCIEAVASRYPSAACVTIMDLSVEAEAFGSSIRFAENEVPSVTNPMVNDVHTARDIGIPAVGNARTGQFLEAAALATGRITDRPVFGCHIGPFSLAARLCGMTEILIKIRKEPGMIHEVLRTCTKFLVEYSKAYKEAGVNGVVIAEPAAGLVSSAQCRAFSSNYISRIVSAVQDEGFMVVLHNCGNTTKLVSAMLESGVKGIHFGNAVDMADIMPQVPASVLAMGNIDPVLFRNGTGEDVRERTADLLKHMQGHRNFVISSGCDIPPGSPAENVDAFFAALKAFNGHRARDGEEKTHGIVVFEQSRRSAS